MCPFYPLLFPVSQPCYLRKRNLVVRAQGWNPRIPGRVNSQLGVENGTQDGTSRRDLETACGLGQMLVFPRGHVSSSSSVTLLSDFFSLSDQCSHPIAFAFSVSVPGEYLFQPFCGLLCIDSEFVSRITSAKRPSLIT